MHPARVPRGAAIFSHCAGRECASFQDLRTCSISIFPIVICGSRAAASERAAHTWQGEGHDLWCIPRSSAPRQWPDSNQYRQSSTKLTKVEVALSGCVSYEAELMQGAGRAILHSHIPLIPVHSASYAGSTHCLHLTNTFQKIMIRSGGSGLGSRTRTTRALAGLDRQKDSPPHARTLPRARARRRLCPGRLAESRIGVSQSQHPCASLSAFRQRIRTHRAVLTADTPLRRRAPHTGRRKATRISSVPTPILSGMFVCSETTWGCCARGCPSL